MVKTSWRVQDISSQGKTEKFLNIFRSQWCIDIYELDLPANTSALAYLFWLIHPNRLQDSINSTAKWSHAICVMETCLFLLPNRAGGFGGYDLYISMKDWIWLVRACDFWTKYQFPPRWNTAAVVSRPSNFSNRLIDLLFDRPGGLGGFDLYYVGIPKFWDN